LDFDNTVSPYKYLLLYELQVGIFFRHDVDLCPEIGTESNFLYFGEYFFKRKL